MYYAATYAVVISSTVNSYFAVEGLSTKKLLITYWSAAYGGANLKDSLSSKFTLSIYTGAGNGTGATTSISKYRLGGSSSVDPLTTAQAYNGTSDLVTTPFLLERYYLSAENSLTRAYPFKPVVIRNGERFVMSVVGDTSRPVYANSQYMLFVIQWKEL